ncbi:hypothetical protein HYDPIDRAFT_32949 [Hydnomerulius pinastri MD-312]|uniref:Amidohydrolase-related domain-containing protein n=1 Tax=Hydnomerulius pinastri MD-312 TaxID=994086 RepID=A0A0C9W1G9_9AGAM|nr:hypothetical protein HYDPIDRAFT_32949 [Hydnomerulius pinastri MD-312]
MPESYKWAGHAETPSRRWSRLYLLVVAFTALYFSGRTSLQVLGSRPSASELVKREHILDQCRYIKTPAGPPADFHARQESDRFVPGTKPVLIKNATIWTSGQNGTEVVEGDLLLHKGLIKAVGDVPLKLLQGLQLEVVDAYGAWVTPGIVDIHSHLGVYSASDGNSVKAPILPWLRSLDGLNTHDAAYELTRSGGVTTAQILPGSANNIGGQAFVMKLRETKERSPTSMLVEPPYTLNGSHFDHDLPPRWRHMKHACGENPSGVYSMTRMDTGWNFRQAYDTARQIRDKQDSFCAKAEAGAWAELGDASFPEDLQWEALVDVLRGRVKLAVHCYEAVDLDGIVRLTNEFKFPVASFHHAGETYLVPDLIKKTWGGAPTVALFAANFRKKREAYRGSEFAPRVLTSHGIPVAMKSDHPVVNSRYLLHEAAQVHYYGLESNVALLSVTATPANAMGLGHRLGRIQEGYDADVVIWDSHPLSLGSVPQQVFIDGIPQLTSPHVSAKPSSFQSPPNTPNFDKEAADAFAYEGLPPLDARPIKRAIFVNVDSMYTRSEGDLAVQERPDVVVVQDGKVICSGRAMCSGYLSDKYAEVIDLKGGSIVPGLTTYGTPLGLVEIRLEPSTNDGSVLNPLAKDPPAVLGDGLIRAVDGLQFEGRNTLLAYRGGVTAAVTAPSGSFVQGVSTAFSLGAPNILQSGSIQSDVAVHVAITKNSAQSVSTQIAALRQLLLGHGGDEMLSRVREGTATLVVDVNSADIMASLLRLKAEYEKVSGKTLKLTFAGAIESHLIAKEIAQAGVSVIVTQPKPYPDTWDQRRILAGPPLTADSQVTALLAAGVNVGVGLVDEYEARNLRWEVARLALSSDGGINRTTALALATTNLEKALGIHHGDMPDDLVAYAGGDVFDFEGKVVAAISAQLGRTDVFV